MIRHCLVVSFVLAVTSACVVSSAPPASGPPPTAPAAGAMEVGVNRNGNDIQNMDLPAPDPALCSAECDKNPQCVAWTYVKPGIQGPNARCWLKNPVPEAHPDDCCTSGVR